MDAGTPTKPDAAQAAAAMSEFFSPDDVVDAPSLKELVIDAIVGVGFPTMAIAITAERQHLALFTGTQHNVRWEWVRSKLESWTEEALQSLYVNLKVAQHAG